MKTSSSKFKLLLFCVFSLAALAVSLPVQAVEVCYGSSECAHLNPSKVNVGYNENVALPGSIQVQYVGRSTLHLSLTGAVFAAEPTLGGDATSVTGSATGTDQFAITGEGSYDLSALAIDTGDMALGDAVTVTMTLVDPNRAEVLYTGETTLATVGNQFFIPLFNPASNPVQQSFLRLINNSGSDLQILIVGVDDAGRRVVGPQTILAKDAALHLTSEDLEEGAYAKGLTGALGDGKGKWRLYISADHPGLLVQAMIRNNVSGTVVAVTDVVSNSL